MTRGVVLGKFMPPHAGHRYLIEFARRFADDLTIVVGSLAREPIPGSLRVRWMQELFPTCRVVDLTDENPQHPDEHPDFWNIWRCSLERVLPARPDWLFASEAYGRRLAEVLGARFVPVDPGRTVFPISATEIRADPGAHRAFMPRAVRPDFVKRVSVFGPESTGKTMLSERLAAHYGTRVVPEYARTWIEAHGAPTLEDMEPIAKGQAAAEDALAPDAHGVLICDTDPLATRVWSETLFGRCPRAVEIEASRRRYDLTLLLEADVPWVRDPIRYLPDDRRGFFRRCGEALERHQRPFVVVDGTWEARFETACRAIEALRSSETDARPPGSDDAVRPEWWREFYDDLLADVVLERADGGEREVAFLVQALDLSPGQRVFDQCCGVGSLSVPLARRGYEVVGVDQSSRYIERARQRARVEGASGVCHFVAADACAFVPEIACEAAFNWWTSFGHAADDEGDAAMLGRAFDALRPGGRFLLDFLNAPGVLRRFRSVQTSERGTRCGLVRLTRASRLELDRSAMHEEWSYDLPDGTRVARRSRLRLYHPHELAGLFRTAGFVDIRLVGSVAGERLTVDSPRCLVLGRKPWEVRA